jgi:hypothetical protein
MLILMNKILEELGIYEPLAEPIKKPKQFTKVRDNIPLKANLNFMADLLFLPEDKNKNRYCFVICDLATSKFDMEAISNKEPKTILDAIKKINKRKYVNIDDKSVAESL